MATEALPESLAGFKSTPTEKDLYLSLFKQADTESLGVLTGDLAVPFFSHSSLPVPTLGEIWQMSDPDNSGFLTPTRFGIACRLIGHTQATGGQGDVNPDWVNTPGPRANFNDPTLSAGPSSPPTSPAPASRIAPQSTGQLSLNQAPAAPAGGGGQVLITPEERAKYSRLFAAAGPVGGVLDGDKAKEIFVKSNLPFDTLGQIWGLADTHSRGSLDAADFTLGMHLIQRTMNGDLVSLPSVLDPKLYASAIGPPPTSPPFSAPSFAKAAPQTPQRAPAPPPVVQIPWIITAAEKQESDGYFATLVGADGQTVDGEKAVSFFGMSGLPIDILAKVWDLADIRGSGALNRDEFAVALKLIRDRVSGKEVPPSLPTELIPPSLRAPTSGAVSHAPQRDLLDLDDDEPIPTTFSPQHTGSTFTPAASTSGPSASALYAQNTGSGILTPQQRPGSALGPQRAGSALAPQRMGPILQPTTSVLNQPQKLAPQGTGASYSSSSGGQARTLSPQSTGFANNFTTSPQPMPQGSSHNFFDENDDADLHSKLSADTTQLRSLEAEHATTSTAVTQAKQTRSEIEASLSSTTAALNELQIKLSTARAAHEAERTLVEDLRARQSEQAALLLRQRTELITAESDLSALRVERTEIEGNFLRDKEDVREMKRKMGELAIQSAELKEILEKLKKESRQQKGLVAIGKKQLAAAEGEKERLTLEIEEEMKKAKEPVAVEEEEPFVHRSAVTSPVPTSSASPFDHPPVAASISLPLSPPVASPASSVRSTNPFERMAAGISPQATGTRSPLSSAPSPPPQHSSMSLPVAAAAALGAGAVAAVTAVGAGVAGVFGGSKEEEEKKEVAPATPPKEVEEKDPFGFPTGPSKTSTTDPFGVPTSTTSADPFGVPSTSGGGGGFDSFDTGFGDDFSTLKIDDSAPVAPTTTHDPAFDDAFAEMDRPVKLNEDGPISSVVPPPAAITTAVEETSKPKEDFGEAFSELDTSNVVKKDEVQEKSEEALSPVSVPVEQEKVEKKEVEEPLKEEVKEEIPAETALEEEVPAHKELEEEVPIKKELEEEVPHQKEEKVPIQTKEEDVPGPVKEEEIVPAPVREEEIVTAPVKEEELEPSPIASHAVQEEQVTPAISKSMEEEEEYPVVPPKAVEEETSSFEPPTVASHPVEVEPSPFETSPAEPTPVEVTPFEPATVVSKSVEEEPSPFDGPPVVSHPAEEEASPFESSAAASKHVEEPATEPTPSEDSSDDEDEIEDAGPSHHGRAAASTSDSGESFVHVPSATDSKFPPLETLEEPTPALASAPAPVASDFFSTPAENPSSPTSELDTFEDAKATTSDVDPSPIAETFPSIVTPPVIGTRRAAPPPPSAGTSKGLNPFATSASGEPAAPAAGDDFDDMFADLPPPVSGPALTSSFASADFDTFDEDDDFSFKPGEFGEPSHISSAPADDAAFADFDYAFDPVPTHEKFVTAPDSAFSFDDAFGEPGTASTLQEPAPVNPPAVSPALDDDVDGVKQIVGMGFSRSQAIGALEKYNYDVGRALNSMLG